MASPSPSFVEYQAALSADLRSGLATEHTYRPALKRLLELVDTGITATNEPKRSECGAPDYTIWRSENHGPRTIGYIEAKDIGVPLDVVERSEQLGRYRAALDNLLLTDYVEFRWYVRGELRRSARLANVENGHIVDVRGGDKSVSDLLRDFLAQSPAAIRKPEELADRMARLTKLIRELIIESFDHGAATAVVRDLRTAFEEVLVPDLSLPDFADMFAQTLAYGLFSARTNHAADRPFRRHDAAYEIPRTNPFLRGLFTAITGPELDDEPYAGLVDDLTQLLDATDIASVLAEFGTRKRQDDPVIHFYETFLAAYDPSVREMRGVYYTPGPVVSYIVRSVDRLLRDRFGCVDGLAGEATHGPRSFVQHDEEARPRRVLILDPACGTGTFLYAVIELIRDQFRQRGDAGMWSAYVREHLIPSLFGFELLMAPYAVAHLKLGLQLAAQDIAPADRADWVYDAEAGDRLGVYLTNTLEEALKKSEILLGSYIAEEANAAANIKRELPILVVLGNPPYSGHSANKGEWIRELVADYAKPRPGLRKPAQAKWLQDDYIKFIRFGQWRITQTGSGVLAFITNHTYLDSPTFAGMRQDLVDAFSDIYVLDLHGNARKKEQAPDGTADQNVFDIKQGVAISLFIKVPGKTGPATIHHASIYGKRDYKYDWLTDHGFETTDWAEVKPREPLFLFVPQDVELLDEYEQGWSIAEIMSENGDPAPGIVTTHDQFAMSMSADEAREKIRLFLNTATEDEARDIWRLCSQSQWNYEAAKDELADGTWEDKLQQVLYRPFDVRWTVWDDNVAVHRRARVSDHLRSGPNLALITSRSTKGEDFAHVAVTTIPSEAILFSPKTSNNGFVFPLYLYAAGTGTQRRLLIEGEYVGRKPNLNPRFIEEAGRRLSLDFIPDGPGDLTTTFGPEDVLNYIYAVLHATGYRTRYVDFLRRDFPRIPLTDDVQLFDALATKGRELIALHRFAAPLSATGVTFPVPGSNRVEAGHPKYLAPGAPDPGDGQLIATGRLYISSGSKQAKRGQYFGGVTPRVWAYHVGGYQVCEKWLKDRRGLTLSLEDLRRYEDVLATISETLRVMEEIDSLVPNWPLNVPAIAKMAEAGDLPLDLMRRASGDQERSRTDQ